MEEKRDSEGLSRVPTEVLSAFRQEMGFSLLIKGAAGSGKTTLVLELLSSFEKPVYISSRVAPSSLYGHFPWLKGKLQPENIIDATQTFLPWYADEAALRTHIKQTFKFSTLPEFFKALYERIEELKNPTIAIDSWEAVVVPLQSNEAERIHLETLLTEIVRQLNVRLIIVSERVERTFLDYVVDGVVTLEDSVLDDRVLRILSINKTRSVARNNKRYVFTLHDNHFQHVPPFRPLTPRTTGTWVPTSDVDDFFSTGHADLDALYGKGLRPGTFNLLEVDASVPERAYSPIFLGLICNFLAKGRGIIVKTMEGINSELLNKKRLFLFLETELINKYLRVFMEQVSTRREIRPYVVLTSREKFMKDFVEMYDDLSSRTRFQPVFAGVVYDNLDFSSDYVRCVEAFYQHLKFIKNSNVVELGVFTSSGDASARGNQQTTSLINDVAALADTHLKVTSVDGSVLLFGVKPYSEIYAIVYDSDDSPKISLLPIV